jgi:hypothetical protein
VVVVVKVTRRAAQAATGTTRTDGGEVADKGSLSPRSGLCTSPSSVCLYNPSYPLSDPENKGGGEGDKTSCQGFTVFV